MTDHKRRSAHALPLKSGSAPSSPSSRCHVQELRGVKIEADRLREKLQKSVIDNPQTAKKAALLIAMWIEGKAKKQKKAG
jgi:hypothetical protein